MDWRELGYSGIRIAPIMFGGNVFGWTVSPTDAFTLLDAFVDAGFNAIDTANVYSNWVPGNQGGESEMIIGAWMKARGNRAGIVIATKVGWENGARGKGLSRAHILQEVDVSLARLQTDYIDLYQAHKDDPETPLEETLETFAELVRSGKVRAIGASNYSAARLAEAREICERRGFPHFATLQPRYNLYDRAEFETGLQPFCREHGIGVLPYYALASGFLTGKYRSTADFGKSPRGGGMSARLDARGQKILAALDTVSAAYGTTPAAVALAWLMRQDTIVAPIASATSLAHLKAFSTATRFDLGDYALNLIEAASAPA
jgi:aryl-alcohol dehydrogenase-like predicted oxidoreductase